MKKQKLPPSLNKLYVSRASFAKMQAEKQRLEKDIFVIVMGGMSASYEVRMKWKQKFEKDRWLSDALREIAKKELPEILKRHGIKDLTDLKTDSNPKAFK